MMFKDSDLAEIYSKRMKEIEMWQKYPYWRNVHGFNESEYDDSLYRIELFDNFKDNVINNRLFFRHPKVWLKDDRLDSVLLRLNVVLPDNTKVSQGYYEETFCQCWSTENSKKMWEEYAKDGTKPYINMVANIECLMRAFDDTSEFKGYSISFWAGKVNYSNIDETILPIRLNSESEARVFFNPEFISKLYLEKRSAFDFENEVRFINFNRKDRKGFDYAFVNLKKPINQILKGIIIDSRISDKNVIEEITSFAKNQHIKII